MKIGKLILKARQKQASYKRRGKQATFGNFIGGSAELATATTIPAKRDMAFIIPLGGVAQVSKVSNTVEQILTERFGVVVCLKADEKSNDEYGVLAYDKLHDIREEILGTFLGWQLVEAYGRISYKGESLLDFNKAYLWYQFEFEYPALLICRTIFDAVTENATGTATEEENSDYIEGQVQLEDVQDISVEGIKEFEKIYTQIILTPDDRIPLENGQTIPLPDGFPDVKLPDIAQWFDKNEGGS